MATAIVLVFVLVAYSDDVWWSSPLAVAAIVFTVIAEERMRRAHPDGASNSLAAWVLFIAVGGVLVVLVAVGILWGLYSLLS